MDVYNRTMFIDHGQRWEIWCCRGVVLGDLHLFYFLFPSYQISCLDFVSHFGDKLLGKKPLIYTLLSYILPLTTYCSLFFHWFTFYSLCKSLYIFFTKPLFFGGKKILWLNFYIFSLAKLLSFLAKLYILI